MKKTPKGKIGRLPKAIQKQVNRRLANGEKGRTLVAWFNALPEVVHFHWMLALGAWSFFPLASFVSTNPKNQRRLSESGPMECGLTNPARAGRQQR